MAQKPLGYVDACDILSSMYVYYKCSKISLVFAIWGVSKDSVFAMSSALLKRQCLCHVAGLIDITWSGPKKSNSITIWFSAQKITKLRPPGLTCYPSWRSLVSQRAQTLRCLRLLRGPQLEAPFLSVDVASRVN